MDPITDTLRRVDNKDKLDTDPPDAKDVLQILKAINFDPWVEDLFTDAFNAVGPVLMMAVHVLVINCLMHNPDVFAERTVRAPTSEKFKADPTFKNKMRYLIDNILMRRRTVKRATNDWDSGAYLEDDDDDSHHARPSRSRSLAHADLTTQGSSAGLSTSRRRVASQSTDRGRTKKRPTATTSRRRPSTLEVSGISALGERDEDDKPLARPRQKTRYQPSPLDEDEDLSQDHEASNLRARKNKRPLNGPSVAKNRRNVVKVDNDDNEEESEHFMTQATPAKKRRRSPSPEPEPVVTTSTKKRKHKEQEPQPEEPVTTSKKHKKNKPKPHKGLEKLISDQDEVLRQLAKGNQK